MEIRRIILVFQLLIMVLVNDAKRSKTNSCPKGCESCSSFNGCLMCKPRYYLLLTRIGMMQKGTCIRTCPSGHYNSHTKTIDKCDKCRVENCDVCFSKNYCSRCLSTHYFYLGKCVTTCPRDHYADRKTGECRRIVDCEVTDWSLWGPCGKNGQYCGYKWGLQARTRDIVVKPTPNGMPCPIISESRQCKLKRRFCSDTLPNEIEKNKHKGKRKKGRKQRKHRKRNKQRDPERRNNRDRYLNPTLHQQPTVVEQRQKWDIVQ
ncbi:R-spondin-2-like [Antedon mediterranea]|uniref:R-spondin-2-like n=1 Tax=Antedon mediterranea TaxID=105859 RepID=UPI003AF851AB